MKFRDLKNRKEKLFISIMTDKYDGVKTPYWTVKEYRFLQREEKRMIKNFKEKGVA